MISLHSHNRIGVDLDETLAATFALGLEYYHDHWLLGEVKDFSEITEHNFADIPNTGITQAINDSCWDAFESSKKVMEALPIPGSQEGIDMLLKQQKELWIITARRSDTKRKENTYRWLETYFPRFQPSHVYFTDGDTMAAIPKSQICRDLGITLLIDDNMENAIDAVTHGITCILPEKPWNREKKYVHPLLYRVKNWKEILSLFQ